MHYTYTEAMSVLTEILIRDTLLHETGRYDELGKNFDEVDERLPRIESREFERLVLAFEFWSGWLDSAEHDWLFYKPIRKADWPVLAQTIINDLKAERETTHPVLLKHFAAKPKEVSVLSQLRTFFQSGSK